MATISSRPQTDTLIWRKNQKITFGLNHINGNFKTLKMQQRTRVPTLQIPSGRRECETQELPRQRQILDRREDKNTTASSSRTSSSNNSAKPNKSINFAANATKDLSKCNAEESADKQAQRNAQLSCFPILSILCCVKKPKKQYEEDGSNVVDVKINIPQKKREKRRRHDPPPLTAAPQSSCLKISPRDRGW